jgi:putative FmdB family regulatory protein
MPTYEYACRSCGEHLEVVQSFKDDALTVCPNCEGELRKVFSAAGIIFKGSGWHVKDYAATGKGSSTAAGGDGGTSDGGGSSSEASKGESGSKTDGATAEGSSTSGDGSSSKTSASGGSSGQGSKGGGSSDKGASSSGGDAKSA